MKRNLIIMVAIFCTQLFTKVQSQSLPVNFKIKGVVKDSVSFKTLDYTTIHLKSRADNKNIKSTLTKDDGSFTIELADTGKYNLVILGLGYKSKTIEFILTADYDFKEILIAEQTNKLNEVVVTADRPILKQEVDRLTYDIQADPENKVLNVLDMMRKVPLLSVDGEDNLQLKGNSNFKILLNGKPSGMLSNNLKDVLKSMSAADIEKIEVITTPPSKYDSEGLAGLINIITKKKVDNGYNANISVRENFPAGGLGGSTSFTVKQGKFGLSGYGGLSNYKNPATTNTNIRNSFNLSNPSLTQTFSQLGTSGYSGNFGYVSSEASFEIDSLNLITAEFGFDANGNTNSNLQNALNINQNGDILQQYNLDNISKYSGGGVNFAFNYQKNFKKNKEQILTFSYQTTKGSYTSNNSINISQQISFPIDDYRQFSNAINGEQTFQVDYIQPIKKLNIEGGIKGILRDNGSDFNFENYNINTGEFILDPSRTNIFDNNQNVFGIYNSYQYKLKDWGFKAGLRLEQTIIKANFISTISKLDEKYLNLIPTVSISKKLKSGISTNFGYTQRIERPGIWQLNPFVDRSNPNFISSGNPDLVPVVSNNFNLNFTKFKKGSTTIGLSYDFANNTIQNVSILEENITTTNYFNIGKNRRLGSNLSINYPITKKLNFNIGGNINYLWLEGFLGTSLFKNEGVQGYLYGSSSYKFEKGLRLSVSFNYSSPCIRLQGNSNAYLFSNFSVSKDIIKDKITFSTSVRNPFNKFRAWRSETVGENFTQSSFDYNYFRGFGFNLNYKFGKLQGDIKKNQRKIQNGDVQGGSSSTSN